MRPLGALPVRNGRLAFRVRDEARTLYELILVNVAWTVAEEFSNPHPNDELGLRILCQQRIAWIDACHSIQA